MLIKETHDLMEWLKENEADLRTMLPKDWQPVDCDLIIRMGLHLNWPKVDWKTIDDLAIILCYLESKELILRKDTLIKCNPESVFRQLN